MGGSLNIAINRQFVFIGAVNGFLAVAFGAFGAHGLKEHLTSADLAIYETGAHYHLTHAIALLAVGLMPGAMKLIRAAGWLFTAGIVLFSGSLYLLAITGVRILGAVTPLGGLAFLGGWLCLAAGTLKAEQ